MMLGDIKWKVKTCTLSVINPIRKAIYRVKFRTNTKLLIQRERTPTKKSRTKLHISLYNEREKESFIYWVHVLNKKLNKEKNRKISPRYPPQKRRFQIRYIEKGTRVCMKLSFMLSPRESQQYIYELNKSCT